MISQILPTPNQPHQQALAGHLFPLVSMTRCKILARALNSLHVTADIYVIIRVLTKLTLWLCSHAERCFPRSSRPSNSQEGQEAVGDIIWRALLPRRASGLRITTSSATSSGMFITWYADTLLAPNYFAYYYQFRGLTWRLSGLLRQRDITGFGSRDGS